MFGKHLIKSWSSNQAAVALSSGEAQYYSMVKAAGNGLGLGDTGTEDIGQTTIRTDASAAAGIWSRIGIGKVRHIEVNQLWLQEKVALSRLKIEKVPTKDNLADAMTKGVDTAALARHTEGVNAVASKSRHTIAPYVKRRP